MDLEPKNVLVFPAGTEIGMEIHSALKYSRFVRLFGGTSVPCHAELLFENCIEGFPFIDDPGFIDCLNSVIDEYHIDYVYPAHDSALMTMTARQADIHCAVVTSPLETVELCRSKNRTYAFLEGSPYLPRYFSGIDGVDGYPVFIKPTVGQGAQGARRINDREHLAEALSDGVEYAICEYLPGDEFTVDCFTDRHGELLVVSPRSRDRIRAGIAVRSRLLRCDEAVRAIAEDINAKMRFNGAWFFQLKENAAGEYRLMEIAPRVAGTMGLSRSRGVNFPLLTLYNMWGFDVSVLTNGNDAMLDRAFISRYVTDVRYESVYVDFDDTIVVRGRVNTLLMMFLYQAKNQGRRLHLLTKHPDRPIREDLRRFGIAESLFDEILHIPQDGRKSEYITDSAPIFIDDSFSERRCVREERGIPVFDLDMIDSLLDWRA